MHPDGGGLYLRVTPEGTRSWIFRFVLRGKERHMGLGSVNDIPLSEARAEATICRQRLREGLDPIDARHAKLQAAALEAAKTVTFEYCAEEYIKMHEDGWRNPKHRKQWRSTLDTYAIPVFGKVPVQRIDVGLVLKVLEPIWKTKPETAGRVRGRIELVLNWAASRGLRQGENPARWRGHLDNLLVGHSKIRKKKHYPALPYAEINGFLRELRTKSGIPARALEFLILTAARSGEIRKAPWSEFNLEDKLWTIPGERMKSGREHRVPLSPSALKVLKAMAPLRNDKQQLVFPGQKAGRPISDLSMTMLLRRMDLPAVPHGFRSSFRDWAEEEANVPWNISETALAHQVGDETSRAYQRGDLLEKRRKLMDDWAQYCETKRGVDKPAATTSSTAA